jgi:hypothetical protein
VAANEPAVPPSAGSRPGGGSLLVGHALAGLFAALVQTVFTWRHPPVASVVAWALVLGVTSWAFATVARALTFGKASPVVSAVAGAFAVVAVVTADTLHFHFQARHLGYLELRFTYEALRTGVLRPTRDDLLPLAFGALLTVLVFTAVFRIAWRWGARPATRPWMSSLPAVALAVVVLGLVFRDLLFRIDDERAAPLFWNAPALATRSDMARAEQEPLALGADLIDAEVDSLQGLVKTPPRVSARTTPRVLLVHVESLRHDMWNAVNMPRTFAWRDRCTDLPAHYSTGNHTSTAVFGVMTGLSGGFQSAAGMSAVPNLPLAALAQLGYQRHVWFPNKTLALDDIEEKIFGREVTPHAVEGDPTYLADREIVGQYLEQVQATSGQPPRFDYLVLDSSHYDYSYPPDLERNRPVSALGGDFNRRTGQGKSRHLDAPIDAETRQGVFNAYKNSVLFVDSQVDRLLEGLAEQRQLASTIVVVFGDHGEAFWDRDDVFGHASALDEAQTQVPLLLCSTPRLTTRYRYTSHADIFPTVLGLMGFETSAPFMTGKSLLSYDPSLDFALVRAPFVASVPDPRRQLITDGLKLGYFEGAAPLFWRVENERDEPWPDAPRDRVERAEAATVIANVLR